MFTVIEDMYINGLINNRFDIVDKVRAKLRETRPPTDYGLIELKHLATAGTIVGGVGLLSIINLVIEVAYEYLKERFANKNN